MILPVLIGWFLGVPLAIWWPRPSDDNVARAKIYRLLRRAALCQLVGFLCWTLTLGINPADQIFGVVLLICAVIGAISLTPFAIGMLGLDFGNRWLGVIGAALATLFPAGLTCYSVLTLFAIYTGAIPWLIGLPATGAVMLCGTATWLVLEAYATMRAPRSRTGGDTAE